MMVLLSHGVGFSLRMGLWRRKSPRTLEKSGSWISRRKVRELTTIVGAEVATRVDGQDLSIGR